MCGIFGYIGKNKPDLSGYLLDGLSKLEYRGYDSAGIAIFDKGKIRIIKEIGPLLNLQKKLNGRKIAGNLGIGHTRWATHGKVNIKNSHPHTDCTGKIAVVHNGIIENHEEIKESLIKKGHKFVSETDTEIFPHLVEEILNQSNVQFKEAVRGAFKLCKGLNAIITLFSQGQIVAFRRGSPLVAGIGIDGNLISSDTPGLSSVTQKIVFLKEEEGVVLEGDKINLINIFNGKEKIAETQKVAMEEETPDKGNHAHFLIKEIYEQVEVISRVANNNKTEIDRIAKEIKNAFGTYFSACGTAAYAGLAATYMFSEIAGRHVNFIIASEFPYFEDFLVKNSLLIAASQSGETMDTLEAVRAAKRHRSKVLAVVNVPGSSLERLADFTLHLNAGPERAVLSTKSYMAKLAVFLLLSYAMAEKYEEGIKILRRTSNEINKMLTDGIEKNIKKIAKRLIKSENIYLIGRGVNYPTALEGALKIKEASYIHAEGFPGGELKHGPISLIEKNTPCVVVVAKDRAKAEILSNAREVAARGAYIIGIAPENENVFDEWIKVPSVGLASALVSVIPLQLMGYYLALMLGYDPDKPRNLAKSVTVK